MCITQIPLTRSLTHSLLHLNNNKTNDLEISKSGSSNDLAQYPIFAF